MSKSAPLVPAVAYIRKSTKGKRNGKERQEKSFEQQRREATALAKGRFEIVRWYFDEGISGWKRKTARPGFAKMLADARKLHDFKAIICDDADRFTRASWRKAVMDIDDLAEAGVEVIASVRDGDFHICNETDPGEAHRLIAIAMANHEFSRKLGRRITLTRRNKAEQGIRTGGKAPYGMALDGKGGLKLGDPQEVKVVRWLYDQFVNHARSLNWLTGDLNKRKVKGPRGGVWYVNTVKERLQQPAYRGDYRYNFQPNGAFYTVDAQGEVMEKAKAKGNKLYIKEGVYVSLVRPALWDKAQRRLNARAADRSGRKRMGYCLTGVLKCDHCGRIMHGARPRGLRVYRCSANAKTGMGSCGCYQVREDAILPFILKLLGEEMDNLSEVLTNPPEELRKPYQERKDMRQQHEREREALASDISKAERNLMFVEDARTRKSLDQQITAMRDQLEKLETNLTEEPGVCYYKDKDGKIITVPQWKPEDVKALKDWYTDFEKQAVSIPYKGKEQLLASFHRDPQDPEEEAVLAHPLKANQVLQLLGAEVRLRWEAHETGRSYQKRGRSREGKGQGQLRTVRPKTYRLVRGRFRLGQQKGQVSFGMDGKPKILKDISSLLASVDRVFDGSSVTGKPPFSSGALQAGTVG
jgi:DNA invertase Pin-like site-specific DNA recombinase